MTLLSILAATLAGGVVSVWLAASVALTWLPRIADRLLAFAVGILLAFALTRIAPEAVHLGLEPEAVGYGLLAGILAFFLLERAILWRHDHAPVPGEAGHAAHLGSAQVALVVLGDGLHNFVDGVLIAAAFLVDPVLGWSTAAAVLAHELPQELGDFTILLAAGCTRRRALALNALSGLGMVLGGVAGWLTLTGSGEWLPWVLVAAAASFLYLALTDLLPALNRRRRLADTALQMGLLALGVGIVTLVNELLPHVH
ncbi:MAG: ZIP family metal transporter [Thiobacillaceae bacterium]